MHFVARRFAFAGIAGLSTAPLYAQSWESYASADASVHYESIAGGNGINASHDKECNGTSSNCVNGFTGRHSPSNAVANASARETGYVDANYGGPGNVNSNAYAISDLSTGELKLYHSSTGPSAGEGTSSGAQAQFYDYLHFDLNGAVSPVSITVDLRVDGSFEGFTQPRYSFGLSDSIHSLNTGIVGWSDSNPLGPSTTATATFIDFGGGTGRAGNWTIYGPDRFLGTFLIDPTHPNVSIAMSLSASGPDNTYTAFQHTAGVNFVLPQGVTFTSASGAFLTAQDTTAVPEPATWATMIAGFALLGAALRRRRTVAALA